jgi:asparagine synthase (glutamine-hydrolysing)
MANSIEIRVPYLEKIFVEWAFSLPGRVLLPPKALHKFLLRQMCAEFYSDTQLSQPKRGFTLPFAAWLVGPLREVAEEGLRLVKQYEVMPSEGVGRLQRVFLSERRGAAWSRVWCLVALGYWLGALRRL